MTEEREKERQRRERKKGEGFREKVCVCERGREGEKLTLHFPSVLFYSFLQ